MADYVPLYLPGNAVNSTASATITGGQAVYVSGSGTVANAAAAANIPVGWPPSTPRAAPGSATSPAGPSTA
jgi:hypothetical protein